MPQPILWSGWADQPFVACLISVSRSSSLANRLSPRCWIPLPLRFYYKGIYGFGWCEVSNARLVADIRRLAENRDERLALGHFARGFVVRHFGLETVCPNLQHYVGVLWLTIYDSPMLLPMASERQQFICENEGF